jgi:hypothetical protein
MKPGPDYERLLREAVNELTRAIVAGAFVLIVLGIAAHIFD